MSMTGAANKVQFQSIAADAIISGMGGTDSSNPFSKTFNDRPLRERLAPADFDLVVNKQKGNIWVLHGKPFMNQITLTRAEYNRDTNIISFITHDGSIQYLGAPVHAPLQPYIEVAREISAVLADDEGNIINIATVPLKQTGGNSEKSA